MLKPKARKPKKKGGKAAEEEDDKAVAQAGRAFEAALEAACKEVIGEEA